MSPYLGWPYKSEYGDVTSARYTLDGRLSGWLSDNECPDRTYAIFTCPTTKLYPRPGYWGRSYGYNLVFTSGREELTNATQRANAWAERRTLQSITWKPSNIVLTADSYISAFMGVADFDASITHPTGPRAHVNMKVNMQFVDGHVSGVAKGERNDISFRDYLPNTDPGWP
jgi:prepilin-type processing-associated H-X9-DG protein